MVGSPPPSRLRGRQAEARRNDLAVLEAARDVFASQGAEASMAAVAARAGVGIGSLYRRYGSKQEMLQRLCVLAMDQTHACALEALATEDPWEGLAGYVRTAVGLRSGALAPLAPHVEATPEMWRAYRRSRDAVAKLVTRAHRAGSLRADATAGDVAWLVEHFGRHPPDALDGDEAARVRARLLTIALDGLRSPAGSPLPGRPPSRRRYEERWTRASPR